MWPLILIVRVMKQKGAKLISFFLGGVFPQEAILQLQGTEEREAASALPLVTSNKLANRQAHT